MSRGKTYKLLDESGNIVAIGTSRYMIDEVLKCTDFKFYDSVRAGNPVKGFYAQAAEPGFIINHFDRDTIYKMFTEGKTDEQIAEHFKCSQDTFKTFCSHYGYSRLKASKVSSFDEINEFDAWDKKCGICGKHFVVKFPNDYTYKRRNGGSRFIYFCSWSCYQKHQKKYPSPGSGHKRK